MMSDDAKGCVSLKTKSGEAPQVDQNIVLGTDEKVNAPALLTKYLLQALRLFRVF